jgi:hypothetical protein
VCGGEAEVVRKRSAAAAVSVSERREGREDDMDSGEVDSLAAVAAVPWW